MKTLIDRTVPRYTEIQNKDFYFIVAAADTEQKMMDRTIEGFRGFTQDCLTGARERESFMEQVPGRQEKLRVRRL